MTAFAIDTGLLLLATYVVGCAAGCWLRRTLRRR
ncbi:hypothetical protein J2X65_004576 [Ancylobacter sp. 3268]|nr:hypothetical protein [Ancylobacter sp. 3268]